MTPLPLTPSSKRANKKTPHNQINRLCGMYSFYLCIIRISLYFMDIVIMLINYSKKKDLILTKSKEKNETIFLMYLFPLRYK